MVAKGSDRPSDGAGAGGAESFGLKWRVEAAEEGNLLDGR